MRKEGEEIRPGSIRTFRYIFFDRASETLSEAMKKLLSDMISSSKLLKKDQQCTQQLAEWEERRNGDKWSNVSNQSTTYREWWTGAYIIIRKHKTFQSTPLREWWLLLYWWLISFLAISIHTNTRVVTVRYPPEFFVEGHFNPHHYESGDTHNLLVKEHDSKFQSTPLREWWRWRMVSLLDW